MSRAMPSDRWRQISQLCHAALAREGDREAFLEQACAGDEVLRREVESLLAQAASAEAFLAEPAVALAAQLVSDPGTSILTGHRIGAYQVQALLGAGGMGEVYLARDTKLGRDVAIKILPRIFTTDPERLARFEREARMLASLNHPHIGAIYGVEESDGGRALILELVEGPTLADRLIKGPIPLTESLGIARQIAEALDAAHERGIVHRDLKPANIKITPDGIVKVLDFGLAKAATRDGSAGDFSQSPTVTVSGAREGVILGSAAYMSPEQARGMPVDKRADIWAFGCVLYEMLTGRRAFEADDLSATLAFVITKEPDWSALPVDTPASIRKLLRRCLEKDRKRRQADIADARLEIEDALTTPLGEPVAGAAAALPTRRGAWALAVGCLLIGVVVGTALWLPARPVQREAATPVTRLLVDVRPAEQLGGNVGRPPRTGIALSPDGRSLVFSAVRGGQRQLYLRQLVELAATPISGTDGANAPFFSYDGQWVGYWASGELRKVPLGGGVPVTLSKNNPGFGASWGSDGRIVFDGQVGGLWQISANGGMPEPLTSLDPTQGEVSHRLPHVLPGGDAVVFTVTRNRFPRWSETQIVVYSRRTGKRTILIEGGADARYVATGHLVYAREGVLMAAPFDLTRLEVTGGSVGVIADLMQAAYGPGSGIDTGAAQFTVSDTGALAYIPGGVFPAPQNSFVLVDRTGRVEPLPIPPGPFAQPRLSPGGDRFAVYTTGRNQDIWVANMARSTFTRLTTEGRNASPVWTPDGTRIVYRSAIRGADSLFWRPADGSGAAEPVTVSERNLTPASWSPDGQVLAFYDLGNSAGDNPDIWVLPMNGDRKPRPILATQFVEGGADFSPDGQWLAYDSNESGRFEVYVRAYPGLGGKQMISTGGGISPIWRRDGQELVYIAPPSPGGDNAISVMAVPVTTQPVFRVGTARRLFGGQYIWSFPARSYDVTADGTRFLMVQVGQRPPVTVTDIVLVQNWTEELKRLVPVTR